MNSVKKLAVITTTTFVLFMVLLGCQHNSQSDAVVNWYNNRAVMIENTVFFSTLDGSLYQLENGNAAEVEPALQLVFKLLDEYDSYIYFYDDVQMQIFRFSPSNKDIEMVYDLAESRWDYPEAITPVKMKCVNTALVIRNQENRKLDFDIKGNPSPLSKGITLDFDDEDLQYKVETPEGVNDTIVLNYDDTHIYFSSENALYRVQFGKNDEGSLEHWEEITKYLDNWYYEGYWELVNSLDIIDGWLYYDYGEYGKARVRCSDLSELQVLVH